MRTPTKRQAAQAAYRAAHREEIRARDRAYWLAHKDERLAYGATYLETHREEAKARHRAYWAVHKGEFRAYQAIANADRVSLAGEAVSIHALPEELRPLASLILETRREIRKRRRSE